MKVTLITHTPEPEKVIACAAKLCYSSSDIESLTNGLTEAKIESFIKKLADLGHQSPLEHCTFTFGIEGISRSCSHQLVRHRIASYSQKSQRYVTEGQFDYVIPPEIESDEESRRIFVEAMEHDANAYDLLTHRLKTKYINNGMDEKSATKKAIEDARFVLPNACETKLITTMNIRALLNFFTERCCNRAQWEIQQLANTMLGLCKEVAPNLFVNAGASCVRGKCKEGKMTCGKPIGDR